MDRIKLLSEVYECYLVELKAPQVANKLGISLRISTEMLQLAEQLYQADLGDD